MKRRRFLWICGCAGVGMMIGIHSAEPAHAVQLKEEPSSAAPRNTWMHGSVRTGCARLPQSEPTPLMLNE